MLVRAPLVEAEQDSSIRIEDLTKVGMARLCLGLAEERLVPFEATRHIAYADDRPGAFHDVFSRRPNETELSHCWQERTANIENCSIKSNVDFTAAGAWLQRLVRANRSTMGQELSGIVQQAMQRDRRSVVESKTVLRVTNLHR